MKFIAFIIIVALLLPEGSFAQTIIINGTESNRKLTWEDFTGTPDPLSIYPAYTYWNLTYRYSGVKFNGDAASMTDFSVVLRLNAEKTWVKKGNESSRLLEHEQGHFDIGRLAMLEFIERVHQTTFFRGQLIEKVRAIFSDVMEKYKNMSVRYDEETDHLKNSKKQKEWELFLKTELQKYNAGEV